MKVQIPSDIHAALWTKFLFIAAFSGVGALKGAPAGALRSNPENRSLLLRAMEEIYALAHARGIALPEDSIEKAMASVDSLPDDATSSMQRDIAAGKPSELEAQNGAVVRMAIESGVHCTNSPVHLRGIEAKRRKGWRACSPLAEVLDLSGSIFPHRPSGVTSAKRRHSWSNSWNNAQSGKVTTDQRIRTGR